MPTIEAVRRACIAATTDLWHGNAAKGVKPNREAAQEIAAIQTEADKPGANAAALAKKLAERGVTIEKEGE